MKNDHIHKYERRRLGSWKKSGHEIYKCALPGCNHYLIEMETVVGRYSQCWGILGLDSDGYTVNCPNEVEMTRYMIFSEKRKRPLCDECKRRRKLAKMTSEEKELDAVREAAIERLMAGLKKFGGGENVEDDNE